MVQNYLVMKNSNSISLRNKHYKQCVEQVQVQIVITTMRKYARIDYDFDTLNNAEQRIVDLTNCHIDEKIRAYALRYVSEHNLPISRMPKIIGNAVGGFEFLIEDVDKVGIAICKIIEGVVNSGCIQYESKREFLAKLSPEDLKDLKGIFGEEYFK